MGYWGWRPLILLACISVWIEGCSYLQESTPPLSPTEYPLITLTVRHPLTSTPARSTVLPYPSTSSPLLTPIVGSTRTSDDTSPHLADSLLLQSPTCYDSPTGGMICLGEIKNDGATAAGLLAVQIRLTTAEGRLIAEQVSGVERHALLPGESAPYRVQFTAEKMAQVEGDIFVAGSLIHAEESLENAVVPLVVEQESGALLEGHYAINVTLYNPNRHTVDRIRLVAILRGEDGRIRGYRVVEPGQPLAVKALLPLVVAVVSYDSSSSLTHELYAEGVLAP